MLNGLIVSFLIGLAVLAFLFLACFVHMRRRKLRMMKEEHILMRNLANDLFLESPKEQKTFKYDAFLSHNWGLDMEEHDNHKRVARLNRKLKKRGIRTWFDADRMQGHIIDKMVEEEESHIVECLNDDAPEFTSQKIFCCGGATLFEKI